MAMLGKSSLITWIRFHLQHYNLEAAEQGSNRVKAPKAGLFKTITDFLREPVGCERCLFLRNFLCRFCIAFGQRGRAVRGFAPL